MKRKIKYLSLMLSLFFVSWTMSSCSSDFLNQIPTSSISANMFWKTPQDALTSTLGTYNAARSLFGNDYYFDGQGECQYTRGTSLGKGSWSPQGSGSSFDYMWQNAYTVINYANYTIMKTNEIAVKETNSVTLTNYKRIISENRFLRALAYFRLIQLWGDVPYFSYKIDGNDGATQLARMPISQVKDSIIADLDSAALYLPVKFPLPTSEAGRAAQVAAIGFRGKVELYWASWKKNGRDELEGFQKDEAEAQRYYNLAALDFKKVTNNYGLTLFMNGDPGSYEKPNYGELFQFTNEANGEILFSVCYGGPYYAGQGESILRDFGSRNTGSSQCWVTPTVYLVNRYQSLTTGENLPPINSVKDASAVNGSINPATYINRDWRMKATLLWDGESYVNMVNAMVPPTGIIPFKYGYRDGVNFINYDDSRTGYIYRKWVRQVGGWNRDDGPQDFYLLRLADVYLMYCEAINVVNHGADALARDLMKKIRHRGNLPDLVEAKYSSEADFFKAVEQERIVEFAGEGIRFFDIQRWRKANEIWGGPNSSGLPTKDTWGGLARDVFKNANQRDFDRYYIYAIPQSERNRNSKITQNIPWR